MKHREKDNLVFVHFEKLARFFLCLFLTHFWQTHNAEPLLRYKNTLDHSDSLTGPVPIPTPPRGVGLKKIHLTSVSFNVPSPKKRTRFITVTVSRRFRHFQTTFQKLHKHFKVFYRRDLSHREMGSVMVVQSISGLSAHHHNAHARDLAVLFTWSVYPILLSITEFWGAHFVCTWIL